MTDPLDLLPPLLREIAEATSVKTALTLARDFGGTRFHFPHRARPADKLSRAVGFEAARILVGRYGGTYRDLPRWAARRKLAIANATGSAPKIAREYGVTERYVRRVRNGQAGDPDQLDLLDFD